MDINAFDGTLLIWQLLNMSHIILVLVSLIHLLKYNQHMSGSSKLITAALIVFGFVIGPIIYWTLLRRTNAKTA